MQDLHHCSVKILNANPLPLSTIPSQGKRKLSPALHRCKHRGRSSFPHCLDCPPSRLFQTASSSDPRLTASTRCPARHSFTQTHHSDLFSEDQNEGHLPYFYLFLLPGSCSTRVAQADDETFGNSSIAFSEIRISYVLQLHAILGLMMSSSDVADS